MFCRFLSQTAIFFKRKKIILHQTWNLQSLCKRINKNTPCQQESAHMVPSVVSKMRTTVEDPAECNLKLNNYTI